MPAVSVSPAALQIMQEWDRWRAARGVEVLSSKLMEVLASVPDPRKARGRRYPLVGLLAIVVLATAAGMRSYAGFATWAAAAPPEVLARLEIMYRRPSEKTFRSVLSRLDAADLDQRLGAYFTMLASQQQGGLLAVAADGKTLRGARKRGAGASHLVSVFAHGIRLVLGQLAVDEKSNEIPCLQKLLKIFTNVRLLVTIDAMHTQTKTAKLICHTLKSHYLMIVKANTPKLAERIQALPWNQTPVAHVDGPKRSHGRIETRTLKVVTAARGIGFPYAKQVIQIVRERVIDGKHSVETVYAVCSLPFEKALPKLIAQWLRQHWGIENAVHWVRDVTFDEDRSSVHTGAGPLVMATFRNTALNIHRLRGADNIAEACRRAAFSQDRCLDLLTDHQISRSQAC